MTAVSLSLSLFVAGRMSEEKGRMEQTSMKTKKTERTKSETTVVLGEMKRGDKERKSWSSCKIKRNEA